MLKPFYRRPNGEKTEKFPPGHQCKSLTHGILVNYGNSTDCGNRRFKNRSLLYFICKSIRDLPKILEIVPDKHPFPQKAYKRKEVTDTRGKKGSANNVCSTRQPIKPQRTTSENTRKFQPGSTIEK
ncbi:hypothetical protein CEXT_128521 [Caerostris extrusa]|uniref:Uncharacterized protein n=1 Tax=Caerostris extrusa TaxID=172846 RepID=A0AAV4WH66_CAEEX|nr:hypothetical protein CEXT_128521 [Caerostris extrusa]